MRLRTPVVHFAVTAVLSIALAGANARAADPLTSEDKKRAAAAYDEGVAAYNRAEFEAAARAFMEADRIAPSTQAITNAIAAARRANDHLLVVRAAERAIARGDALTRAREALSEAAGKLARLELGCEASPCAISVDGEAAAAGGRYMLPGAHRIRAEGPNKAVAEEPLVCVAGATYRVTLRPVAPPPMPDKPFTPAPVAVPQRRGLHPGVFFAATGVTLVLAGVTTWSGVDAIAAKRALPASPEQSQNDDVLARARRTDWLLLGAGLAGVGTAVLGIWLTDWRGRAASASVTPLPGGAAFAAGGRF